MKSPGALPGLFYCASLLVELAELDVNGVAMMASMTLACRKQRRGLFSSLGFNAPFFSARHHHRCVEGLAFCFVSGSGHGFVQRITAGVEFYNAEGR